MNNGISRRSYLALAGSAAAATLIPVAAFADSSLAAVKARGALKIGVKYDNPGFGYLKAGESEPTGFEIDLAHEITKRIMGDPSKVQFTQVITSNRIPMVQNGDIDMFIATATITPDRLKQIAFSNVYYSAGESLLVKMNSTIKSYQDLAGKTVCTAKGSTPEQTIHKLVPTAEVQTFDGYTPCYQAPSTAEPKPSRPITRSSSVSGIRIRRNSRWSAASLRSSLTVLASRRATIRS